jgi:predicted DNA-binding protein with PD1-like motif
MEYTQNGRSDSMNQSAIVTGMGPIRCHSLRLRRGADLMQSIKALCEEKKIAMRALYNTVNTLGL